MRTISSVTRRRLEMQGFVGFDDAALAAIRPGLRIAPALCMVWVVAGTLLASPVVLSALIPVAVVCALLGRHPFDVLYNYAARALLGMPSIPRYATPRRFACRIAAAWLAGTSIAFAVGAALVGTLLGTVIAMAMLITASTDFCPPCFAYGRLFGKGLD